jgi:tRNA nucleotidyltransferase (CCA-adding enzyme)
VHRQIEDYVRGLGLDAYVVGGAVRDELLGLEPKEADFLVAGVGHAELRAALEPHGKVEDLVVAGQRVGLRLWPRGPDIRRLVPHGIELAPPRAERSTGPGRHDFEIVASPEISVEEDMARRDFTVNAVARRLADGAIVDPFGGRDDVERRVLRTVSERSFEEDPLRIVRALRFISQLGFEPDDALLEQMREHAGSIRLVSAERIGGGLADDGMGELSKLLLGSQPRKALRIARDTGVLREVLPPLRDDAFDVVQQAADDGATLPVRLAALIEGLGSETVGSELRRLRYPTNVQSYVKALVAGRPLELDRVDPVAARRFLRRHGAARAFDLVRLERVNRRARDEETASIDSFEALLEQERNNPHRLADLAVDGADLIGIGYQEGPELGQALETLLDAVVDDPTLNERETLLERAGKLLVG